MKTKYLILISLVFFLLWNQAIAQNIKIENGITFDNAVEITFKQNPVVKQIEYQSQEKNQTLKAARGLYLPNVGLNATYCLMQDDLSLDLTGIRDAITPLYGTLANYGYFSGVPNPDPITHPVMPILPDSISTRVIRGKLAEGLNTVENGDWNPVLQKKQFGVLTANVSWPIYAGGKINSANAAARIEKRETDEAGKQKEAELMSELVERYYGLSLAKAAVGVRQEVFKGMQMHLSDALKMEKGGIISKADALHAQLFYSQAERELSKAKRQEDIARDALLNTLAIESDGPVTLLNGLFFLDTIESQEYFIKQALTNSPLLAQIQSKKQLVNINHRVQTAGYLPEVAAFGTYNLADKDLSTYTPEWMLGVGLKWTIFDGATSYRKIKASSLKCQQVDEIDTKAKADISLIISKLYQELSMYKDQLKALETSRNFAEEYVRVSEKSFKEEIANETQVVDARLALAQVNIERLQAMYGYDISLAKILQYSGMSEKFSTYNKSQAVKN